MRPSEPSLVQLWLSGGLDLIDVLGSWAAMPNIGDLLSDLAMVLGGGGALLTGLHMDRTHKLEKRLDRIVGERDNIPLDELFAAAGIDAAKGRSTLDRKSVV